LNQPTLSNAGVMFFAPLAQVIEAEGLVLKVFVKVHIVLSQGGEAAKEEESIDDKPILNFHLTCFWFSIIS
jgi:hypothetical protein